MSIAATYIDATTLSATTDAKGNTDLRDQCAVGTKIRADCGAEGYKYGVVSDVSYSDPTTTIVLSGAGLTSNLIGFDHGNDTADSLPTHGHTGPADGGLIASGTQFATCSSASDAAAKVAALSGFALQTGACVSVLFVNENTVADAVTLNVNATGDIPLYDAGGQAVGATHPAYFPAGSRIAFVYDGSHWLYERRIVESYVNGTSWYRVYADGWIEQGGRLTGIADSTESTLTYLKPFKNLPLSVNIHCTRGSGGDTYAFQVGVKTYSTTAAVIRTVNNATTDIWWEFKGY